MLLTCAEFGTEIKDLEQDFAICYEGELSDRLRKMSISPLILGSVRWRYPWTVYRARLRLKAALLKKKYDVILCHGAWIQTIFGSPIQKQGLPQWLWNHDFLSGKNRIERWAIRSLRNASGIICNSEATLKAISKILPQKRATVIHCPVKLFDFNQRQAERRKIRRELSVDDTAFVFLQLGRIERGKGHQRLLEALYHLKNEAHWEVWIVGAAHTANDKRVLAEMKLQADHLGHPVRFLGHRHDVGAIYAAADLFVQINTVPESFGITYVEALSMGLPVVTRAMGGAEEIIDRKTGSLLINDDPSHVAEVLSNYLNSRDLLERMSKNGPARAREISEPRAQLRKLQALLLEN